MSMPASTILLGLCLSGFLPQFGDKPLEHDFPRGAEGDLRFQADVAIFHEAGAPQLEIAVSIPSADLSASSSQMESLLVAVEMLDEGGDAKASFKTTMVLPADSADVRSLDARLWFRLRPRWVAGTAGLRVRIEDLGAIKAPLLHRMQNHHPYGELAARIQFPHAPMGATLSSLLLIRGRAEGADSSAGLRGMRAQLEPHPYRYFGRSVPELTVYWERYPLAGDSARTGQTRLARYRFHRLADSTVVAEKVDTLSVGRDAEFALRRFSVGGLATGSYRLELTLSDEEGTTLLGETSATFQVVWERALASLDDRHLAAYGRVLLPAIEFERFAEQDRGGREAFLRALWNRVDPTPPGEPSAVELKFHERARYVEQAFGGWPKGVLSDRGRVYVRYGAPDEVTLNLNPQDEELLWRVLPGEIEAPEDSNEERVRQSRHRSPQDNAAYEIWEYQIRGDPLLPEYILGQPIGIKFIFADELGIGSYSLIYSNLVGGLQ